MGRDFLPVQTGPGAHPASCTMGTESFPGVKSGRGVLLTTHPLLVQRSWRSRAIALPTLWATTGPVTGALHLLTFFTFFSNITALSVECKEPGGTRSFKSSQAMKDRRWGKDIAVLFL